MPTIHDVAKRAGVSSATVSHTINGTRFVDPATQERVRQAIIDTDYRPNHLARSLRRRESRTIGLVIPDNTNPFFAEMARAIEDAGFAAGYSVVLCNSDRSVEKEAAYVDLMLAKQVDGLILASANAQPRTIEQIANARVPVLLIPGELGDFEVDILMTDDLAAGRLAAEHLLRLGHTRIACISGPRTTSASAGRVAGCESVLAEAGLRFAATARGDFQAERGREAMAELLDSGAQFTALFAANDLTAIGALLTLHRHGLRVPADVSVIGFDNMRLSSFVTPSLTTIAHSLTDIGPASVELLIARMADLTGPPVRKLLPATLVVRESTTLAPSLAGIPDRAIGSREERRVPIAQG